MRRRSVLLLGAALLLPISAGAQNTQTITVRDAVARPTLAGAPNGIAFMRIENHGAEADRLLSVSTPVSAKAAVHEMSMSGNIMRMRPTGPLTVPAGGNVTLDPDNLHLMLLGMKRRLKAGDTFPLTLHFEHAGDVAVTATVKPGG